MSLFTPTVKFSSISHPIAKLGRFIRLWSKPTPEQAAATMGFLLGPVWILMGVVALLLTENFMWAFMTLSLMDGIGRLLGVRSSYGFLPV